MKEAKRLRAKLSFMVSALLIAWPVSFLLGAAIYYALSASKNLNALQFVLFATVTVLVISIVAGLITVSSVEKQVRRKVMPVDTYRKNGHIILAFFPNNQIAQILISALIAAVHTIFFASGILVLAGFTASRVPAMIGIILNGVIAGCMVLYAVYFTMASRCASLCAMRRRNQDEDEAEKHERKPYDRTARKKTRPGNEAGTFDLNGDEEPEKEKAFEDLEKEKPGNPEDTEDSEEDKLSEEQKAAARKSAASVREHMERRADEDRQAALEKKIARMKASQKREEEEAKKRHLAQEADDFPNLDDEVPTASVAEIEEKAAEPEDFEEMKPEMPEEEPVIFEEPEQEMPEEEPEVFEEMKPEMPEAEPVIFEEPEQEMSAEEPEVFEKLKPEIPAEEAPKPVKKKKIVKKVIRKKVKKAALPQETAVPAETENPEAAAAEPEDTKAAEEPKAHKKPEVFTKPAAYKKPEADPFTTMEADDIFEDRPESQPEIDIPIRKKNTSVRRSIEQDIPNFLKNTRQQLRAEEDEDEGIDLALEFPEDEIPSYAPDAKTGIMPDMEALGLDYEDFDETDSVADRKEGEGSNFWNPKEDPDDEE